MATSEITRARINAPRGERALRRSPSLLKMGLIAGLMSTDILSTQLAVSAAGGNYDMTESDPFMWLPMTLSGGVLTPLVGTVTAAKIAGANGMYMYAKRSAFSEEGKPDRLMNRAAELFANVLIATYSFATVNNIYTAAAIQWHLPPPPWEGILQAVGQFEEKNMFDPILQGFLNVLDFFSPETPAK